MTLPLLTLRNIRLQFSDTPLLHEAQLSVFKGDRICLVGRNGCGKSTLLKLAAGMISPDSGERFLQPGVQLSFLSQESDLTRFSTALEAVENAIHLKKDIYYAKKLLNLLQLSGGELPAKLSGGELRRIAIARALVSRPDILLLDEPTNHLDLATIAWLEKEIAAGGAALVMISHDRRFLENMSHSTLWIHEGTTHMLSENFTNFEAWRDDFLRQETLEQHKLKRKIHVETEWLKKGVTARRKRNQRRLKDLYKLRQIQAEQHATNTNVKAIKKGSAPAGQFVAELKSLNKAFGKRKLVDSFSLKIMKGARIGVIGPNGTGKTTLLSMLTGKLSPDSGLISIGSNVKMLYIDQQRINLNAEITLQNFLTDSTGDYIMVNGKQRHITSYMKDFLFLPKQAKIPIHKLSGGERARLLLAKALAQDTNFLVLDEPTNDLDLETLDVLQEILFLYEGTLVFVSHDRDFLDRIATSVIAADGKGKWIEYAGGYTDMTAQRGLRAETENIKKLQKPKTPKLQTNSIANNKIKLSYKDSYARETLPKKIDVLLQDIADYKHKLEDPGFYKRDPKNFSLTAKTLENAQKELIKLEDQWIEIEEKFEENLT